MGKGCLIWGSRNKCNLTRRELQGGGRLGGAVGKPDVEDFDLGIFRRLEVKRGGQLEIQTSRVVNKQDMIEMGLENTMEWINKTLKAMLSEDFISAIEMLSVIFSGGISFTVEFCPRISSSSSTAFKEL